MVLIKASHTVFEVSTETKTIRTILVEDEVPPATLQGCLSAGRKLQTMNAARGLSSYCWEAEQALHSSCSLLAHEQPSHLWHTSAEYKGKRWTIIPNKERQTLLYGLVDFLSSHSCNSKKLQNSTKYVFPKHLNIHVQSVVAFFMILVSRIEFCGCTS